MKRKSALAKAFKGRWSIVEMDTWPDDDHLNLVEPAHINFEGKARARECLTRAQP